ncbi:MAG: hypothetical protein V7752_12655 [Halopseudomonas sp.]
MSNKVTKQDWEIIEADYRACQLSLRQIGAKNGVSESGIRGRAKKFGWERDLSDKVHARIKSELARNSNCAVPAKSDEDVHYTSYDEGGIPEEDIISAAARTGVEVVRSHRRDIAEFRDITRTYARLLRKQVQKGKRMIEVKGEAVEIDLDLEYISKCLNSGSNAIQRVISMERQAFSLDDKGGSDSNKELESIMDLVLRQKDGLMLAKE